MLAKFEVCQCGKHGRIVLKDGFRGAEVCCKELGLHFVRTGVEHQRLNDEEVTKVMNEVLDSPLPQKAEEVDKNFLLNVEVLNQILIQDPLGQDWIPEVAHELLQLKMFGDKEVPVDLYERVRAMLAKARPQ